MTDAIDDLAGIFVYLNANHKGYSSDCEKVRAEIIRLRASLRAANEQAAHFERLWYLRDASAAWAMCGSISAENEKLRAMLSEAHELLHKLTSIIPGNDTAGEEVAILLRAAAAALKETGDE